MPLIDLVQQLNNQHNSLPAGRFSAKFRISGETQVFVHVANLALESVFLPITATASRRVHGHAAVLRAYGLTTGNPVSAEAVFVLPADDQEFVYVDRLVRTLHVLSYLARPLRGRLHLKVNRRHVMSVPTDHGLAFEEILRSCGLTPQQVTLEFDADGVDEVDHFTRAVAAYRQRGYGIALSGFGRSSIDLSLVHVLQPDIVKFDLLFLASTRPLEGITHQLHQLGVQVAIEGPDYALWQPFAGETRADLFQPLPPEVHWRSSSRRHPDGVKAAFLGSHLTITHDAR
ncbi:MAG: EAL domain-containing protein [Candidatus Accumulibacter sp. UW26]|jgi:EAL domain-containing protein (putative c-di-GMP-specific phosphodiesterase class I)